MATLQKSQLTSQQRQLVELMQDINFGRICNLPIQDGVPVFSADTLIEREIKFGGQNGPRPELDQDDFVLKQEVMVMLDHIAQIIDGCVGSLEIKHGLPFLMRIRTYLA
jgi:hypothetical protein